MNNELNPILRDFAESSNRITILTGAGISAESGIPKGFPAFQHILLFDALPYIFVYHGWIRSRFIKWKGHCE